MPETGSVTVRVGGEIIISPISTDNLGEFVTKQRPIGEFHTPIGLVRVDITGVYEAEIPHVEITGDAFMSKSRRAEREQKVNALAGRRFVQVRWDSEGVGIHTNWRFFGNQPLGKEDQGVKYLEVAVS